MQKLLAIDGFSLLHRAYYAMPFLSNKEGVPTGAISGFMNMLINAIEKTQPDFLAVAMDMKGPTFRHEMYADYKGNRPPMPDELRQQVGLLRDVLENSGIKIVESQGYEADDVIGTLSRICSDLNINTIILTGDRDSFQLINDHTTVWMTRKGISDIEVFDEEHLLQEYGLKPEQIIDLKGLMGDQSDNIPGIPMVGMKTAQKLLAEYHTLKNVLANAEHISGKKLKSNVIEFGDQALLSYDLARIDTGVDGVVFTPDSFSFHWNNFQSGLNDLKNLELTGIQNRIERHFDMKQEEEPDASVMNNDIQERTISHLDNLMQYIDETLLNEEICIYKTPDEITLFSDGSLVRIPIARSMIDSDALTITDIYSALKKLFESNVPKVLYDLKSWFYTADSFGFGIHHCSFDVMIAAYIINANANNYSFKHLADTELNNPREDAFVLKQLKDRFKKQIIESHIVELFQSIEMPLIRVLYDMERNGFRTDKNIIKKLDEMISADISESEQAIYKACGETFNINSPKQLSHILFEKMGLTPLKKTKSGYSTDAETLEQLSYQSEFVNDILSYRQLSKLKGTYIDGLLPLIDGQGRIHSTFNQTIASTGRISSSDPNLQNIPVRTALGREFRKIFVSDSESDVLVDADYSQIELRVLAHLSDDKTMQEAFRNGYDIHKDTASKMWHIPFENVTGEMRSAAKAINFGIVYGISDFGLSRNIGISVNEAHDFIARYKQTYKGVSEYMDHLVETAKKSGYAETMFGRRRMIPELTSSNFNTRSFGARIAMNMPIQGTAADIIKLAMIRVHSILDGINAKLLLQVHDELIVNTKEEYGERIRNLMKKEMETIVNLHVPLIVDVKIGRSWYETK